MDETPQTLDLGAFKHVVVPIGVIIALGVARIVSTVSSYTQHHTRVRFSAAHAIWSLILFLWFVGLWWIAWGLRHVDADLWSFFTLIFLLVGPCLLFMATTLLLPDVPAEGELDLAERIEGMGRPFFLSLGAFLLWLVCSEIWLLEEPWMVLPKRLFQGTALIVFSVGAAFPRRRVATALGVVTLPLLVVALATVRAKLA